MNDSGVLGMPFRIAISLMVIALMIPAVVSVSHDMDMAVDEAEGVSLAEQVAEATTRAYFSGVGSAVSLSMDIPSGRVLEIGGEGADSYSIRIYSDGRLLGRVVIDNPPIRMLCPETKVEGEAELLFEAVMQDGRVCVAVTAA